MPVPGKKHPRPSATFFSRQYSSFKSLSSMQESLGNWITNIVLFNKKINKFKNNQEYKVYQLNFGSGDLNHNFLV